jgi:hypothetical protein
MTTLIAVYNSDGCVGRCDARCYDAVGGTCDCICGGRNHGAGAAKAMDNTREMGEAMITEWNKAHPGQELHYAVPAAQRSIMDLLETSK